MGETKHSKNGNDGKTQTNGVMITVYVESSTTRSRKLSDPAKKSMPQTRIKTSRTSQSQGYDRRALLLAYSRQLRNMGSESQDVQGPTKQQSRHKSKEEICSWFQFCSPSSRMLRQPNSRWRYDRMPILEKEELSQPRKKRSNGKTSSPFLRKLKGLLKEMSCKKIKL